MRLRVHAILFTVLLPAVIPAVGAPARKPQPARGRATPGTGTSAPKPAPKAGPPAARPQPAPPPAPAAREHAVPVVLADDARLARKVSLAERDRPFAELLPALGSRIGLPLTAAPETGDDRVTAYLADRPAAEALALLAAHFGFQWVRQGGGYELTQSEASRKREEELREQELAPQRTAIERRMELVARLVRMSRPQIEARLEELDDLLKRPAASPAERTKLKEERAAAGDCLKPGAGAAAAAYAALDAGQRHRLRLDGAVYLSTADRTLSPAAGELIHEAVRTVVQGGTWNLDPQRKQADVVIRLDDSAGLRFSPQTAHARRLRLEIGMASGDGRLFRPLLWTPAAVPEPPREPAGPPLTVDPALGKPVTLRSAPPPAPDAPRRGWRPGLVTLGELAEAIHRDTGLGVIADSFTRARFDPAALPGRSEAERLEALAAQLHYDWQVAGGTVRLRSRIYYRDRTAEAPERVLGPWKAALVRDRLPTAAAMASLAGALSESQARGLFEFWGWRLEGTPAAGIEWAELFFENRHHLRLLDTLTKTQLAALSAGKKVSIREMTPRQRQTFVAALTARQSATPAPATRAQTATAEDLADAGFGLSIAAMERQTYSVTTSAGGRVELHQVSVPGRREPLRVAGGASKPEPVGAPAPLQRLALSYYLAGTVKPARSVTLDFPRPAAR